MDLKTALRYILPVAIMMATIYIGMTFIFILAPFIISYIMNFGLKPFVNLLERRGTNHTVAVTIVFIAAFGLISVFFALFIPAVGSEISNIQNGFDLYSKVLTDKINIFRSNLLHFSDGFSGLFGTNNIQSELESSLKNTLSSFVKRIPGLLLNLLPLILYIGIIPFATFFLLLDDVKFKKRIIELVPNRYFETTLLLLFNLNRQMVQLLRGMCAEAIIFSILASFGMWLIKLDYPIIIGIFAGFSNLIPYVGPVVGTLSAFLVAIMTAQPPIFFLYIILVFIVIKFIDDVFVQPIVFSKAANLHPLIVIILVLLGSELGGVLGMFLAVPLASLFQVILKMFFTEINRPRKIPISEFKIIKIS